MFLGIDGKYSAFEEIMHYYHFDFKVYYILVLIVFVNCIKAILDLVSINKRKISNVSLGIMDLLVSILCGIGLGYGMIFQGVMSDISQKYFNIWGNRIFVLCVICLILFIIQLIFTFKIKNVNNKHL